MGFMTFGQNHLAKSISISFENESITTALHKLESQGDCQFSYNPDILSDSKITKQFVNQKLEEVLKNILGAPFIFTVRGSYIIIRKEVKKSNDHHSVTISGQISDANTGEKIENVSIYEVDNLTASLSSKDGRYELSTVLRYPTTLLAISKEHYKDTIVSVEDLQKGNFKLSPKTEILTDSIPEETKSKNRFQKFVKNEEVQEHEKNIDLEEERLMQFSLLPVLGTNGMLGGKVSNSFSLNLIAGYAHSVDGVEIGGVLNMDRKNMKGTQIAGVSNLVGERMTGVQIAGVSNTNFLNGKGVQVAGVMNSAGVFDGTQISGTYNYVKHTMHGFQASGAINYAGELQGVQLGVVNFAKKVDKGVMIGILNFAGNGIMRFELEHNDLTHYNLNFKSGTKKFYSVFSAGITPQAQTKLWAYGMGFGSQLVTKEKYYFGLETTSNTIFPLERHIDGITIDNRIKTIFAFNFFEHFSICSGPIVHYYLYPKKANQNVAFYESIGYKPFASTNGQKAWIGYHVSVRF
jgi:predicted small secreted protein